VLQAQGDRKRQSRQRRVELALLLMLPVYLLFAGPSAGRAVDDVAELPLYNPYTLDRQVLGRAPQQVLDPHPLCPVHNRGNSPTHSGPGITATRPQLGQPYRSRGTLLFPDLRRAKSQTGHMRFHGCFCTALSLRN
jgi:hypothetical protein